MISNQRYINSIYIQTKTINTTQIDILNIEVFPSNDGLNVSSIETFPIYDDVDIPNIETFPMDESDEMDNIIFIDGVTQAKNLNIPKSVARQVKKTFTRSKEEL
ncbi:hypothetical protein FDE76_07185 [Clostridium botulinum]|nr:hypothetical protein [Clostridium botulinum]NFJ39158.1 hypothetical protein [Clostridium botulinum B str. Eklund 17B (NRP)]MBY7001771.1 hypothetical protein [Clostridium botulinum]MCR1275453.1 hypothetical protein [Clostridium botulinum]NFD70901.1 hypothetical protein [Clostridium botulinum]